MKTTVMIIMLLIFAVSENFAQAEFKLSETGKKFAYYQIKGVYGPGSEKIVNGQKTIYLDVTPKPNTLLIRFISKDLTFQRNDIKFKMMSDKMKDLGMKVALYDDSTLAATLPNKHPANRCIEVIPRCEGFPFQKFKEIFEETFEVIPRFAVDYNGVQYKGVWEYQPISMSILTKDSTGNLALTQGSKSVTPAIGTEFENLPFLSFEMAYEGQDKVLVINNFFQDFGKTVVINKSNSKGRCYFYDTNFKPIKWQNKFPVEVKKLIKKYQTDFIDLADEVKVYLSDDVMQFWETCKETEPALSVR